MGRGNNNTGKRKWKQINEEERYKIEAWLEARKTPTEIAEFLGKTVRTIKREIEMGMVAQRDSEWREKKIYKADYAQMRHEERASNKGRSYKIGHCHKLAEHIEQRIGEEKYSPDAVLGEIKEQKLQFEVSICTKTLYNMIDRGFFLRISNKDLPIKKDNKKHDYKKVRRAALNNKKGKSISERAESVETRQEFGHWEIDLVLGKKGTKAVVLTLVERKSRKSLYVLAKDKTQKEVMAAIKKASRRAGGEFSEIFKSITADNGSEFLDSLAIKEEASCGEVYCAHPYSSWERGSNENGNRMLRRFIPKGTNLGTLTEERLQRYEDWVNNYPRRIFKYKTANMIYAQNLA